jgi:hypothetical protein
MSLDANVSKPLKYLICIIGFLLPLFLCACYIHSYAVSGVWQDEWAFVQYLEKIESGICDFAGLFQYQHNEHKLFVPSLLLVLVAHFSQYDGVAIQYVGLGIMTLTAGLFLTMSWPRVKQLPLSVVWLIPVLLISFSLRQWENLICCFPYSILLVSFFFVATIVLLDNLQGRFWCLLLGLLSALCCTYSYANGLLVWPLGLLQILGSAYFLMGADRRTFLRASVIWTIFAFLVSTFYLSNYVMKKSFAGYVLLNHLQKDPGGYIRLFIDSLATPLMGYLNWASAAGLTLIALAIVSLVLFAHRTYSAGRLSVAPMSLLLFGLSSSVLIFLGRAAMGSQSILCSRYSSLTNLWLIGFYLFLISSIPLPLAKLKATVSLLAPAVLAVLIVWSYAISFQEAQAEGDKVSFNRLVAANELLNYKTESDETLLDVLPFPKIIRLFAPYLEERHYSVFKVEAEPKRRERTKGSAAPQCQFDCVGITSEELPSWGGTPLKPASYNVAKFSGWIVDYAKPEQRIAKLFIDIDGKREFEAACRLYRPDVVDCLHKYEDAYKYSGFHLVCRPDIFSKGVHSVSIRTIANDGEEYISPTLATFFVH